MTKNIDILSNLIESPSIKIVSIDIFSTLILYPVIHFMDIFYFLDEFYTETFKEAFIENNKKLSKIRIDCEKNLILEIGAENVSIDLIYNKMSNLLNLSNELINTIKEKEYSLFLNFAYLNSEIFYLLDKSKENGKKVILISDTYYTQQYIILLLNKFNILYDNLYTITNLKKIKDTGKLYEEIIDKEKVFPFEILHIGDNEINDYIIPQKKGIVSYYYYPTYSEIKESFAKIFKYSKKDVTSIFLGYLINEEINISSTENMKYSNLFEYGYYSFGPFILSLVLNLLFSNQIQDKYNKLIFTFVDGYLPFKMYEYVRSILGIGISSEYINDLENSHLRTENSMFFNCIYNVSSSYDIDTICLWIDNEDDIIYRRNVISLLSNYDSVKPFFILFKELFSYSESKFSEPHYNEIYKGIFEFIDKFCKYFNGYLFFFKNLNFKSIFNYTMQHLFNNNDTSLSLFQSIAINNKNSEKINMESLSNKLYLDNHANPFKGNQILDPNVMLTNQYDSLPIYFNLKVGFHLHLYYIDLCLDFIERIKDFPCSFDLYITTTEKQYDNVLHTYFSTKTIPNLNKLSIIFTPNRGRDIAPWLIEMKKIQTNYDIFGHFHTKKSNNISYSNNWRNYLLDNLLQKESIIDIFNIFIKHSNVGIIFPPLYNKVYNVHYSAGDPIFQEIDIIKFFLSKLNMPQINNYSEILFSAGTMFWYRPLALKKLFLDSFVYNDFSPEPIGTSGTLAHAIERLPSYIATNAGYITKLYMNQKLMTKTFFDLYYDTEKSKLLAECDSLSLEKEELISERNRLTNDLNVILNSKSWLITKPIRALRYFLKENMVMYTIIKLLQFMIFHPIKFLSKLTPKRIWLFFYAIKTEGSIGVLKRFNNILSNSKVPEYLQEIKLLKLNSNLNNINDYEKIIFNDIPNPLVSIIIPVYNQFNYTYNCLKSIYNNSGNKISYEIIIADDCSDDITTNINAIISNITIVKTPTNLRFLKNCNNAAKFAKGKYILFLNNDTQVQKKWLAPLVELIEIDEKIGAVGSKILLENGLILEAVGVIWKDALAWNYGRSDDPSLPEYNYVKEVDYLSGAALMLRKSIWEELGGFDELYAPSYYEDPDLCFSIRKMGYKVMYQPLSVVIHFEGISNGTDTSKGLKQYQILNQKKFFQKWQYILENEHFTKDTDIFLARDRSKNKKTILIIDNYVPQYDKDAGSRTIFHYIKLFLNIGFNIKFIDDTFCKNEPYTTILEQLGIEVLYGFYYSKNWKLWLKNNAKYIDFVFLSRPHISLKYIDIIKKYTKAKIFYYGHDLRFLREKREYEFKHDKNLFKSYNKWKNTEFDLMNKADISYYPSQVEVNEIKSIDLTIKVKAIPAYLFEKLPRKEKDFSNTKDIMFIGGFLHNPNIDGVQWYIKEIYPILNKIRPEIKTYIIGSNVPKELMKLDYNNVIVTGYITDEQLNFYYKNCRLSIAPLRYGAGVKGKVIEAMHNQIPVVTTTIGAEGINDAENCLFIQNDPVCFAEEIIRVYDDLDLLSDISIKEIDLINKSYSFTAALDIISNDFNL